MYWMIFYRKYPYKEAACTTLLCLIFICLRMGQYVKTLAYYTYDKTGTLTVVMGEGGGGGWQGQALCLVRGTPTALETRWAFIPKLKL